MASYYRALAFALAGARRYGRDGYEAADLEPLREVQNLVGTAFVVTGGSRGIGFAVSEGLIRRGARVHVVCRDEATGASARERLNALGARTGGSCELHVSDLSSLAQTRGLVEKLASRGEALHGLVCNAGVMRRERTTSSEGYEYNFAVNTLGTHVLIAGLRPVLGRTAAEATTKGGYAPRVVVVSSGGMLTEPLDISDLEYRKHKTFDAVRQYARGKRHQVAMTERWARVEGEKSGRGYVGFYSMHPGWCETDGVATSLPRFNEQMRGKLRTPAQGADTVLWLLTEDPEKLVPGEFYFDRAVASKHITGGFTRYDPSAVDALVQKLDTLATEGSVRSERAGLRTQNSFNHMSTK